MSITLKAARVNAGYGLAEAAKAMGVSIKTLNNWESARSFPNVPQITLIENLYGLTYNDINFLSCNSDLIGKGGE